MWFKTNLSVNGSHVKIMDAKLNKEFHALIPDLPLNNSDREVVRFAIIIDASNYQHLSWSDLDDEQARTAIRMLRCQITRLNKKAT